MRLPVLLALLVFPGVSLGATGQSAGKAVEADLSARTVTGTKADGTAGAQSLANRFGDLYRDSKNPPASRDDGRAALVRLLRTLNSQSGKKVTWVGDSITEQGKPGNGNGIGFTTYIEQGYPNITYSNQGIGGQTTLDVIGRLSTITATNADLYVLAIGINDARYNDSRGATTASAYVANITTIVNALKAGGKSVVVLSIWPSFWSDQYASLGRKATDDRFKQWNAALEQYCIGAGIPYVDAYSHIVRAVNFGNVTTLIPDGVHPDYNGTAGKKLYATAVLRGAVSASEFAADYVPTGSVFYKIVIFDHGRSTHNVSIQNINPQPSVSEFFAYSANAAVDPTNLFGAYNAAAPGFLNKAGDWPIVLTFSSASFLTSLTTVERAFDLGIRSYDLYVSTDPKALTDPGSPTWVLAQSERTNDGIALNMLPPKREGAFYRLEIADSAGTDGTGGTTGTYVKVTKVWGGATPVRWAAPDRLSGSATRSDLVFSSAGGDGTGINMLANNANTYPFNVMWESPLALSSLTIASVQGGGAASRAIKNWKLYQSRDPASISSSAHSSWGQIASGVGDQTIGLTLPPFQPLAVNATQPSVANGRNFITANSSPTTITDLLGGVDGQAVTIVVNDANTTFNFTSGAGNLKGNGAVSFAAPQYSVLTCTYSATVSRWHCTIGSSGSVSRFAVAGSIAAAQVTGSPTNGGSVTPNANSGNTFVYTAGAGVAGFTVNVPVGGSTGIVITVNVKNASGGALTTTWNAAFKMATWTAPATGQSRSITFEYDGTNWVEIGRTPADVPN